ncbi:potassium-transporting ATPase subunit KdpA [Salinarimonas ramus]|uniref:potassium-transporting ATPase subunit KdpA n=1 Tax=Salinarimonas ramus TaxID=690164 RepID=UPI0035711483
MEGAEQVVSVGPAASQFAIKQLGTNGGGFFNVNSTHPLENPSYWTNALQLWASVAIPLALAVTFRRMTARATGTATCSSPSWPVPSTSSPVSPTGRRARAIRSFKRSASRAAT